MTRSLLLVYLCLLTLAVAGVHVAAGAPIAAQERHTPEGTFCTPQGVVTGDMRVVDPSHPCHCEHMTYSAPTCEGVVQENSKCANYCKKEACRCPVICTMPVPQPDAPEDQ